MAELLQELQHGLRAAVIGIFRGQCPEQLRPDAIGCLDFLADRGALVLDLGGDQNSHERGRQTGHHQVKSRAQLHSKQCTVPRLMKIMRPVS